MHFNTSEIKLRWCLGTLVKKENRTKKTVKENVFNYDREKRKNNLEEEKKIHERTLSNKIGEQSTGRQFLPKKGMCSINEKEIYHSP